MMKLKMIGVIGGLLVGSSTLALAQAERTAVSTLDRSQRADPALPTQLHHACADIMGLDPSQAPYETCVRSLANCASEAQRDQTTELRRLSCAREGLVSGTPAFAICVVKKEGAADEFASTRP